MIYFCFQLAKGLLSYFLVAPDGSLPWLLGLLIYCC